MTNAVANSESTVVTATANAIKTQLRIAAVRYAEHNAVLLVCGSGDTDEDILTRAPKAMRETLAKMIRTREQCVKQSGTAWRQACDAVNPLFVQLLEACGVQLKPAPDGLGSFTVPEVGGNSFAQHTFTTEGIDSIHVGNDGGFSAHVKMVRDRSHWTETLTYSGNRLAFVPD